MYSQKQEQSYLLCNTEHLRFSNLPFITFVAFGSMSPLVPFKLLIFFLSPTQSLIL